MPLHNRQENETSDLGGVLQVADSSKIQFGRFASLSNWVAAKLKSIKKKRGVVPFQGNITPAFQFQDNFVRTDCSTTFGTIINNSCTIAIANNVATVGNGCGFFVCPCTPNPTNFVQATYKANRAGTPVSGIFLAIPSTATRTSFTGYGLVYDQSQVTDKVTLYRWSAATLASVGTKLASANITLADGDILNLTMSHDTSGTLVAQITQPGGNTTFSVNDNNISHTTPCIGLIGIGTGATSTQDWTNFSGGCSSNAGSILQCCSNFIDQQFNLGIELSSPSSTTWDPTADVTFKLTSRIGGTNCNGAVWWPIYVESYAPGTNVWCTPYNSNLIASLVNVPLTIVGTPRIGVCVRVDPNSTCASFTGYATIADYTDRTVKVVKWVNQPLSSYGTILESTPFDVDPINNIPHCEVLPLTGGSGNCNNSWIVRFINTIADASISATTTNNNVGLIVLGSSSANAEDSATCILYGVGSTPPIGFGNGFGEVKATA